MIAWKPLYQFVWKRNSAKDYVLFTTLRRTKKDMFWTSVVSQTVIATLFQRKTLNRWHEVFFLKLVSVYSLDILKLVCYFLNYNRWQLNYDRRMPIKWKYCIGVMKDFVLRNMVFSRSLAMKMTDLKILRLSRIYFVIYLQKFSFKEIFHFCPLYFAASLWCWKPG